MSFIQGSFIEYFIKIKILFILGNVLAPQKVRSLQTLGQPKWDQGRRSIWHCPRRWTTRVPVVSCQLSAGHKQVGGCPVDTLVGLGSLLDPTIAQCPMLELELKCGLRT